MNSATTGTGYHFDRLAQLDGVRALLALWVLFGHASLFMGCQLPFLSNPAIAVDLFMVLSGLFIAMTFDSLQHRHSYWHAATFFWIRRVMRIWPLYAVVLTLSWLFLDQMNAWTHTLTQLFPRAAGSVAEHTGSTSYLPLDWYNVVMHYSLLFGVVPELATATPLPDWSLSLEFQFYLLFPLLVLAWRKNLLWLCIAAACLAYLSPIFLGFYVQPGKWAHFLQPSALPYKLNLFLVGVLAYQLRQTNTAQTRNGIALSIVALTICLAVSGFLTTLGIALMGYLLFFPDSRLARVLSMRPLRFYGEISYTIYLVHRPLLLALGHWLATHATFVAWSPNVRFIVLGVLLLIISTAASWVLYVLIERPGNRLGHRWTRSPAKPDLRTTPLLSTGPSTG